MTIDVLWRPFETLSNGEQTKVLLAALFLKSENFLLLDEPTNHLDIEARNNIANYLKKKKGFLLVSHDRHLLDECVDHILSINRRSIDVQQGNFSNWSSRVEKSKNGVKNSGSKIDKDYVGHKAAKMMKRAKNIETRTEKKIEEKSNLLKDVEIAEDLKMQSKEFHKKTLASYSNVSVQYNNLKICRDISFEINRGERIFITGKNGSGKSICESAHLYIWDEPLNYIDIYSRRQIENVIEEYSPTMLIVEHDVVFKKRIATKIVDLSEDI